MSDRERKERQGSEQEAEPRRVKVTDRRRVRPEGEAPAAEADSSRVPGRPSVEPDPGRGPGAAEPGDRADRETGDLDAARKDAAEYREHLQRLQAEFENYRKRVLKEQTRAVEMAAEPLARRLLEVLDEFELALMAAEQKPDLEKFLRGVELVYAKLLDTLRAEGLERIPAEGKAFDPSVHEALMQVGEGDGEPVVADVLRQGYTFRGRVVRPAGVKVTRV